MTKTLTKQRNIRKPLGFETKEMEGYFRLPKRAAAVAIVKKLSGTQLRLWLYLMMEDPFADLTNDGEKIYHHIASPVEIALKIGANQETVEKDMRVLKKLGLYDYRATGWEGYNLSAAEADAEAERLKQRKKAAETPTPRGGGLNNPQEGLNKPPERLNNPQEGLNKPPERLNNPQEALKPLPQADSKTPQTIQTSSDLNQTLSDGTAELSTFLAGLADKREREKFLEFGRTEAAKLKKPEVVLVDKWIAKNFEELHRKFKATETATTPDLDEAAKAKQQEILDRRKKANEFLAELKNPGLDPKCVPAPQKNAVKPPENTEEGKLPNQKEEAPEGAENGKEVFSKAAIDERLAEVRAKAKAIEREKPSWKNIEKRGM